MCSIMGYSGSELSFDAFKQALEKTTSRGPDDMRIEVLEKGIIGFQRLSIMGLSEKGMQPFKMGSDRLVCNGEIYGFRPIKEELIKEGYQFESDSDCEILLPLYHKYGLKMFEMLDAEFALVLYDGAKKNLDRRT